MSQLVPLIRSQRVIVCCGAGGVGKTTTSAAIAIAAARMGRKVLVLTIDPSRRLAEALGVSRNPPEPVPLPEKYQREAGIQAPGSLEAWMLDPKIVADQAVRKLARDAQEAERLLDNRIYRQITRMVAGMQEYTAMKALHRFLTAPDPTLKETPEAPRYDLIVLDTPPSRHALDFLEAPGRVGRFLEGRIFRLFLPAEGGFVRRAASSLVDKALSAVFGAEFASDITSFFSLFAGIFGSLNQDLAEMRTILSRSDVAFLLVTTPSEESLREAEFFSQRMRKLALPFRGYVLNRSHARARSKAFPFASGAELAGEPIEASTLEKLRALASEELALADRDLELVRKLQEGAGNASASIFVEAMPYHPGGADEGMSMLLALASLMSTASDQPALESSVFAESST